MGPQSFVFFNTQLRKVSCDHSIIEKEEGVVLGGVSQPRVNWHEGLRILLCGDCAVPGPGTVNVREIPRTSGRRVPVGEVLGLAE